MAGNDQQRTSGEGDQDPIEQRLLDDQEEGQQAILDAATAGFDQAQKSPDHPTRTKRELQNGQEDPAHAPGSTRAGPG